MGLVKNTLLALLFASTAGAQVADSGYKRTDVRSPTVAASAVRSDATASFKRRAARHGIDEIPFPYTGQGQALRISLTNPHAGPCPVQFAANGQTLDWLSFSIPPGMTWATEDFFDDYLSYFESEDVSIKSNCAVANMKVSNYGNDPVGVYGHSIEPRKASEALREQPPRLNNVFSPAPDAAGMDLGIAMKAADRSSINVLPYISQSYQGALFSLAVGKTPFYAIEGRYGFGAGIAHDNDTGFITLTPDAPVFGPRASSHATAYGQDWKPTAAPVLGEAVIRDTARNNDSYAALLESQRIDWAVILGVANKVPGTSMNTPEPMEYTTIPTFFTGDGRMYIGVGATTHVENGAQERQEYFEHPARRNPILLAQPEGTYSAIEVACLEGDRCFIPFANTQQRDAKGLIGVERNIIGTAKDIIDHGEMGIASMVGEYKGARTEFDLFARTPTTVRIDIFNDLGRHFGSATYTMAAGEYRRAKLTDIAPCTPHAEMTYGHARAVVLNEGGQLLAGFSRFDNGGGDKIVGKFNPVKMAGQLYQGSAPDITCDR